MEDTVFQYFFFVIAIIVAVVPQSVAPLAPECLHPSTTLVHSSARLEIYEEDGGCLPAVTEISGAGMIVPDSLKRGPCDSSDSNRGFYFWQRRRTAST